MANPSDERRELLLREADRMTKEWQMRYLRFDDAICGSTELRFAEPTRLVINGREIVTERAELKAVTEPVRRLRILLACEGEEALLTDVLHAADEITPAVKEALFDMGFSLLGAQLDQAWMKAIDEGPSNNALLNCLIRFL